MKIKARGRRINARRVKWEGEITVERFGVACLALSRYFIAHRIPGDDPEDAMMDFVAMMIERRWFLRYDSSRGPLDGFIIRYASLFLKSRRCRLAVQCRMHESHRQAVVNRPRRRTTEKAEAADTVRNIRKRVSPMAVETLDAIRAADGDYVRAAALLDVAPYTVANRVMRFRSRVSYLGIPAPGTRPE